ncbi:MAG: hypothetical protein WBA12_10150, partial [Catalinimonas sp.]
GAEEEPVRAVSNVTPPSSIGEEAAVGEKAEARPWETEKRAEEVRREAEAERDEPPPAARRRVEGGKQRPILILVDAMSDADRAFLTKVLQALQLSWDDVAVADADQRPVSWRPLVERLRIEQMICFGVTNLLDPTLPASPYQLMPSGKFRFVLADSLAIVAADAARKKMLWRELRQMFAPLA